MPLCEIIGATPVGKNFNIAYAFMRDESEGTYRWVLTKLRSMLECVPKCYSNRPGIGIVKCTRSGIS